MSFALRALIFGYTGETAKALIKVLAQDPRYSSVKLVGRREADVDYGGIDASEASKKFKLHVIDFDQLDDHPSLFEEVDVGFSLLGTTRTKSNKEQYRIIDHDYAVRLAELALNAGCKEYYVVTSAVNLFLHPVSGLDW